jgi:hypothetical protein
VSALFYGKIILFKRIVTPLLFLLDDDDVLVKHGSSNILRHDLLQ